MHWAAAMVLYHQREAECCASAHRAARSISSTFIMQLSFERQDLSYTEKKEIKIACCSLELGLTCLQPLKWIWCQKKKAQHLSLSSTIFLLTVICCPSSPQAEEKKKSLLLWFNSANRHSVGELEKYSDFTERRRVWRHLSEALKWNELCKWDVWPWLSAEAIREDKTLKTLKHLHFRPCQHTEKITKFDLSFSFPIINTHTHTYCFFFFFWLLFFPLKFMWTAVSLFGKYAPSLLLHLHQGRVFFFFFSKVNLLINDLVSSTKLGDRVFFFL